MTIIIIKLTIKNKLKIIIILMKKIISKIPPSHPVVFFRKS